MKREPAIKSNEMSAHVLGRLLARHYGDAIPGSAEALRRSQRGGYKHGALTVGRIAGKVSMFLVEHGMIRGFYQNREVINYNAWKYVKEHPEIVEFIYL